MDKDNPSKVSLGDRQMHLSCRERSRERSMTSSDFPKMMISESVHDLRTITYLDDDLLILRDDGDPLVFLEGHGRDSHGVQKAHLLSYKCSL